MPNSRRLAPRVFRRVLARAGHFDSVSIRLRQSTRRLNLAAQCKLPVRASGRCGGKSHQTPNPLLGARIPKVRAKPPTACPAARLPRWAYGVRGPVHAVLAGVLLCKNRSAKNLMELLHKPLIFTGKFPSRRCRPSRCNKYDTYRLYE